MFVPSILPYEALLAPISPDAPSGVDLREVGDDIDQIIRAGKADVDHDPLSHAEGKQTGRGADWSRVIALSIEALSKKSKDLVIAARLTEALIVRHGLVGLREGTWLLRELIERFWEGLYPGLEDGDVEYRAQPFVWLNDKVAPQLDDVPLPQDYQPLAELEATLETATGCREEFLALYGVIEQNYGRNVPRVSALHDRIVRYEESVARLVERKRAAEGPAATDGSAPIEGAAARSSATVTEEPQDRDDALRRLAKIAAWFRKQSPRSPLAYRIGRIAQWSDGKAYGSSPPAQSDMPAPPTELRVQLQSLEQGGSWSELLEVAEGALGTPPGRFWLDLQRYAVSALEHLGDDYAACAEAVKTELRAFANDFATLPKLYLSDFTAAATPETQTWLAAGVLLPEREASRPAATNGDQPKSADTWREAQLRAHAGQKLEALEMLRTEILKAPSGREAFGWKLRLAELCIAERLPHLALPLLEELAEEIDRFHLEEWEPRELSARVFSALFSCYQRGTNGSNDYQARARDTFARLCRLDVSRAFRDGSA